MKIMKVTSYQQLSGMATCHSSVCLLTSYESPVSVCPHILRKPSAWHTSGEVCNENRKVQCQSNNMAARADQSLHKTCFPDADGLGCQVSCLRWCHAAADELALDADKPMHDMLSGPPDDDFWKAY